MAGGTLDESTAGHGRMITMNSILPPGTVIGFARRLGLGSNSMRRPVDRVEAVLELIVWLATTVIVLATAMFAFSMTSGELTRSSAQSATLHPVTAVLLQDATMAMLPSDVGPGVPTVPTDVRWTDTSGNVRTGQTPVPAGQQAGSTVTVWLDGNGELVGAPMGTSTAEIAGISIAVAAGVGAEAVLLAMWLLVQGRLNHVKARRLATEWAQTDGRWRRGVV